MARHVYQFDPDATCAVQDGTAHDMLEVTWRLGRDAKLSMDLPRPAIEGLRALAPVFDVGAFRRAIGDREGADLALRHLVRRGLVLPDAHGRCRVSLEAPDGRALAEWTLPVAGRVRAIDLLVGDGVALAAAFGPFAARRPPSRLVGWVRLEAGEVEVGPVHPARDAPAPAARRKSPPELLAGGLEARLRESTGPLEALLRRALRGPRPRTALSRGWARLDTAWSLATGAYRVDASPMLAPGGTIEAAYALASVDDTGDGFGAAAGVGRAAAAARYEAFERFALSRDDLAPRTPGAARLPSLATASGLAFDFFRALAPRSSANSRRRPAAVCVVRPTVGRGAPHSAPLHWVYFSPGRIANSNGAAFGKTVAGAIAAGRREVIERDLIIRGWYGLSPSRELGPDEIRVPRIERWRNAAADRGLAPRWFLIGDSGDRAAVLCMLTSPRPPYLSTGAATRPHLASAVEKALLEAALCRIGHLDQIKAVGWRAYAATALAKLDGDPRAMGLHDFGDYWAVREDAFAAAAPAYRRQNVRAGRPLDPRRFVFADLTPPQLGEGVVVKVLHPDAAPLPSCLAHLRVLERLLGVREGGPPPPLA